MTTKFPVKNSLFHHLSLLLLNTAICPIDWPIETRPSERISPYSIKHRLSRYPSCSKNLYTKESPLIVKSLTNRFFRRHYTFFWVHPWCFYVHVSRLGGRFTLRPQHSQQQLQMFSSFSGSNNKFLSMGDGNRNFNTEGEMEEGGAPSRRSGVEPAERPLMQQRTASSRSMGTVSFRNVVNGTSGAAGSGRRTTGTAHSSFRFSGAGILRHSSSSPASSCHSTSTSRSSSFWRKHGGYPNLMDR